MNGCPLSPSILRIQTGINWNCVLSEGRRSWNKSPLRRLCKVMLIKKTPDIPSSEITPESVYMNRRTFIDLASGLTLAAFSAPAAAQTKKGPFDTDEKPTPYKD